MARPTTLAPPCSSSCMVVDVKKLCNCTLAGALAHDQPDLRSQLVPVRCNGSDEKDGSTGL